MTERLLAWQTGDPAARDHLMSSVHNEPLYNKLRRMARAHLRRERADHSLPPTAVAHETDLRLVGRILF